MGASICVRACASVTSAGDACKSVCARASVRVRTSVGANGAQARARGVAGRCLIQQLDAEQCVSVLIKKRIQVGPVEGEREALPCRMCLCAHNSEGRGGGMAGLDESTLCVNPSLPCRTQLLQTSQGRTKL